MNTYQCNPDGPENVAATKQSEREVFALKMQATKAQVDAAKHVAKQLQVNPTSSLDSLKRDRRLHAVCGITIEEARRHETYNRIPPRVLSALYRYVEERHPTGDFLAAVLSNDLFQAVGRADDDSFRELRNLIRFIYNEVPHVCHGSLAKWHTWLNHEREESQRGYDGEPYD